MKKPLPNQAAASFYHHVPVQGVSHSSFSVMVNAPEVENSDPENSVARFAINGAAATFTIPIISLSASRAETVSGVVHSAAEENPKKLTASPVVPT